MLSPTEQLAAANKATVDALLAVANTALSSAERIAELNLNTAQSMLEGSVSNLKALMDAKDVAEAIRIQVALAQPAIEKALAYSQALFEITAQSQAEMTQLMQEQFGDFQRSSSRLLEQAVKTGPVGSDEAFSSIQNAFAAAYRAFGSMNAAVRRVK